MPLSDYSHWNEDAEYMWWNEEGKHDSEPPYEDDYDRAMNEWNDPCADCDCDDECREN